MTVVDTAGPYGKTTGTSTGPSGPSGQSTFVYKFSVWADADYIYGIKLFWDSGSTYFVYGDDSHGTKTTIEMGPGEWVCAAYVCVDPQNYFRGIGFDSNLNTGIYSGGYTAGAITTAFEDNSYKWTDMIAYTGTLGGNTVIWGIEFYYTAPSFSPLRELALPALGVMAHTMVVARSLMKVGKLRSELKVIAPSCEPPAGTDPLKVELWHRTFRAQENCKESLLVYFPSILVASAFGEEVFGKWASRTVGILSLAGAFFRYKYLNAYIEDAQTRGAPFRYGTMAMKPVFYLAVVSCGYLVGKQLVDSLKKRLAPAKKKKT